MDYRSLRMTVAGLCLVALTSCASVPKEAVQLSDAVGSDIEQLYAGYRSTIQFSFQQMRQNGLTIINERWTPIYLRTFIKEGKLVQWAQQENAPAVEYWARKAIESIDLKRQEFLQPLQEKEIALLVDLDQAFAATIRANAALTAHLKSVRNVEELQDQALEAVRLKEIRDRINEGIVSASNFAAELTTKVEEEAKRMEETAPGSG